MTADRLSAAESKRVFFRFALAGDKKETAELDSADLPCDSVQFCVASVETLQDPLICRVFSRKEKKSLLIGAVTVEAERLRNELPDSTSEFQLLRKSGKKAKGRVTLSFKFVDEKAKKGKEKKDKVKGNSAVKDKRSKKKGDEGPKSQVRNPKKKKKKSKKEKKETKDDEARCGAESACAVEDCDCDGYFGKDESDCLQCGHTAKDHSGQDVPEEVPVDATPEELTSLFKASVGKLSTSFTWEVDSTECEFNEKVGEGASAQVYRGKYRGQKVAIKVLKDKVDDKMMSDFTKEFATMISLRSPCVVFFYGAILKPQMCMVMEWCAKGSLYDCMKNLDYVFDWKRFFAIVDDMTKGINCLHSWKPQIVHRDLKSLNLLVDGNWTVKVCDFGLSRNVEEDNQNTLNKLRGTYAYSAPEVYHGKSYTDKADMYSVGIILWELVTRTITGEYQQPFSEYSELKFGFQIIIKAAKENRRPTIPETCPTSLKAAIEQCWHPDPEVRLTCAALAEEMKNIHKEYLANKAEWNDLRS